MKTQSMIQFPYSKPFYQVNEKTKDWLRKTSSSTYTSREKLAAQCNRMNY